jgi:hypothetical protein
MGIASDAFFVLKYPLGVRGAKRPRGLHRARDLL